MVEKTILLIMVLRIFIEVEAGAAKSLNEETLKSGNVMSFNSEFNFTK